MENERLTTENENPAANKRADSLARRQFSVSSSQLSVEKICSACGTSAARNSAAYCRVCGKNLREDYEPLDNLRSSYNLQRKHFKFEARPIEKTKALFETNENSASTTAWAFAVYSLVPYLGILFCPGAIVMGGIGIFTAHRQPYLGGRRISRNSILVGTIVFLIQVFLWWLLYFFPELRK